MIVSSIFTHTGRAQETVYLASDTEEHCVYDEEGSVIAYKYYITIKVYEDSEGGKLLHTYNDVKESVSPMNLKVSR